MFELKTYYCPGCGTEIYEKLEDGDEYICNACSKMFYVLIDEASENIGFASADETVLANPLGLAKGSVRAISTILLALSCWILIILNRAVPGYVLTLLLTVIGYYFAFRKQDGTQNRFYNVSVQPEQPLSLPSGSIRFILIAGFFISAVALAIQRRLSEPGYIEFFLILTGLVGGYLLSKILPYVQNIAVLNFFNHLKGIIVLGAAVALTAILLSGQHERLWHITIALACIISFYFGSRS